MINIKKQFKIFENYKNEKGEDLIYLDSASSSLTPNSVIEKMNEYYFNYRSNIDRAISSISIKATNEYDKSINALSKYLNCEEEEIIWTSGATMSSNMLIDMIYLYDEKNKFLNEEDEILTTILEHHSSLLPLQKLAKDKKMNLKFLDLDSYFDLDLSDLDNIVSSKTKIVSITLVSNVLGIVNNVENIIKKIKEINPNVFVICDGTSAFGHIDIDMKRLQNVDAMYFSAHKAFGPTGVGVLFLKREISRNMTPSILGGGIVSHVEKDSYSLRSDIKVFEAGTRNIAGVIGTGEAIKFLEENRNNILIHNQKLVKYFLYKLNELCSENNSLNIKIYGGENENNIGIISFQVFVNEIEIHPHDMAEIFARFNISVRAGHHCAEPLMSYFNIPNGLTRISFHIYNTEEDIDKVIEALKEVKKIFGK